MTFIASISSRTCRAPRSAAIAEPTAPAIISEVTSGAPWRSTPMPLTAPMNEVGPICDGDAADLDRDDDAERDRHQDRGQQRDPDHEPGLEEELLPGEVAADDVVAAP